MSGTSNVAGRVRKICLTPVRNESWVINRFLSAAQCWADDVIVADQGSTDGTLQRLQSAGDVHVVINDSPVFDENHRQKLLLTRAREIPGKRILIGLDADEALSANFASSDEWRRLGSVEPGTILRFRWVNVLPGFREAWIPPEPSAFGFVDDGSSHEGKRIHSPRVPQPAHAPVLDLEEVVVLHFQYVAWDRMVSKHRWYQAWERLTHPEKSSVDIFRQYHHMYGSWDRSEIHPLKAEWLEGYERRGIDFRTLESEPVTWWDREVLQMLQEHGPATFRRTNIWGKDWNEVANAVGKMDGDLSDPRTRFEKFAHRTLAATQAYRSNIAVRSFEKLLRVRGW